MITFYQQFSQHVRRWETSYVPLLMLTKQMEIIGGCFLTVKIIELVCLRSYEITQLHVTNDGQLNKTKDPQLTIVETATY